MFSRRPVARRNRGRVGRSGTPAPPFVGSLLQLWLRGDLGWVRNGNDLQSIADQSGNGRNYRQTTASKQPLHKGSTINGRQAIGTFNGSSDGLVQFAGASITATTYTAFAVGDYTVQADGTSQHILDYQTGRMVFAQQAGTIGADDTVVFNGTSLLGGGDASAGIHSLTFSINGASSQIYRDGSALGGTFNPGAIALGSSSGIGARYDAASAFLTGKLGEILVYAPVLSTARRAAVWAYLNSFWGL